MLPDSKIFGGDCLSPPFSFLRSSLSQSTPSAYPQILPRHRCLPLLFSVRLVYHTAFKKMEEIATKPFENYTYEEFDLLWKEAKKLTEEI